MRYLLGILLTALSTPSAAQVPLWRFVADTQTGSIWYARTADLNDLTGDRRKIWVKQDHSRDKTVHVRETKTLFWIECSTLSYATLSTVATRADGTVASSYDMPDYQARFTRAVPETVGEGMVRSICAAGTPWNIEGQ